MLQKKKPGKIHYSICIKKGLNTDQWMGFESLGGTYWSILFTIRPDNTFRQFDSSFILQMYLVFLLLTLKKHCVHILLQFWGRYNCCDEKCTLHILYSKAAFSITPLTISLDRNASILELWNWSLTKSFALYFEAMHQGSRHPRIQYVPLVHISLGSGIGSTYFGKLCLVLRYFEELVLRCSCGCTGHRMHQASSSAAALTLSALVLLAAGLALWEGCPSPLSCCPFSLVQVYWCKCSSTWKGRIWANEGGSQSPDRGFSWYLYYSLLARTFAAAVGASLHWLTAVCQRKCPINGGGKCPPGKCLTI